LAVRGRGTLGLAGARQLSGIDRELEEEVRALAGFSVSGGRVCVQVRAAGGRDWRAAAVVSDWRLAGNRRRRLAAMPARAVPPDDGRDETAIATIEGRV
jgi:hypothetical protein